MNVKSFIFRINDNGEGLDIVRNVCLERGWIEFDEDIHDQSEWNVWWKSACFRASDYDNLKPWQRLNHYPKSTTITRKDCLARNLRRMKEVYGSRVYNFCPLSFNVPNDYTKFVAEYTKLKSKSNSKPLLWICKPIDLSRGRGIFIFKELSELQYSCSVVVQQYITNPMLISGYKFDLRLYVAVPSFHPLTIYIHQESIVRFSTEKYDLSSLNNVFSHLTNFSINKHSPNYTSGKERIGPGCKWTLTQLRYYFHQNHVDDRLIWQKIINIITLTLITQSPVVPKVENCLELYGFDILLDENRKPWLIEVNFSPSLSTDCQIDYLVKKPVLHDLMEMLNLKDLDMDHAKSSRLHGTSSPHQFTSRRYFSQLSRSGSVKHLPDVKSASKHTTPSPMSSLSLSQPIFGLPLVHHSEDEGCFSASGDSLEDKSPNLKQEVTQEKTNEKFPTDTAVNKISHPPRTPRSRYSLCKINSKCSGISDSGVSSFSGNSENSSSALFRDGSESRSAKLKSRQGEILNKKSLCDLGGSDVGNWRFMVRKQISTPENKQFEDIPNSDILPNVEFQQQQKHVDLQRKTHVSVTDTRQFSSIYPKKRHSMTSTKPCLQTSRSRLIHQRQVGLKGPIKKYGNFFLVFPFNDATVRANQTSLDARVIIREIQKQLKEIASSGGSPDTLWYPVRPVEKPV